MSNPTGNLDTSIGTVVFQMTDPGHVHLGTRDDTAIVVRQIPYHLSCHLRLVDGAWTTWGASDPYLSRKDTSAQEPSKAARKATSEALIAAWTAYLAAHPETARKATQANAAADIKKLEKELAELDQQATAKQAELASRRKTLESA